MWSNEPFRSSVWVTQLPKWWKWVKEKDISEGGRVAIRVSGKEEFQREIMEKTEWKRKGKRNGMREKKKVILKSATWYVLVGPSVLFTFVEIFLLLVLNVFYLFFCENLWRWHVFKLILRVLSIFPSPIFRIPSTNYLISLALSTDSWLVNLTFSRSSKYNNFTIKRLVSVFFIYNLHNNNIIK